MKVSEWEKTVDINLKGTFLTVKLALPYLKASKGAVVIVSSVNGNRMFSNSGATAYACTKAAQVAAFADDRSGICRTRDTGKHCLPRSDTDTIR